MRRANADADCPCASTDAACLKPGDEELAKNNPCNGIAQTGEYAGMCEANCNY